LSTLDRKGSAESMKIDTNLIKFMQACKQLEEKGMLEELSTELLIDLDQKINAPETMLETIKPLMK
jgi:hypothetical protein